jgi:hypothetical protein
MKSISIDSENYVKATDIARELGYTADYVGQLCRAEKVKAQLVGRSWYVSEDSIRSHKNTRYRSTKKVSTGNIAQTLAAKDLDSKESFAIPVVVQTGATEKVYAGQQFYKRSPVESKSSYFTDETELIPEGSSKNKTGRLSVSLADAQTVNIQSKSAEFNFNPTKREEIRFSGSLAVTEIEDNSMSEEEDATPSKKIPEATLDIPETKVKPLSKQSTKDESTDIVNKIKVKHLRKDKKKTYTKLPLEHNVSGVLGMRRERISDRNPMGGTLKIAVPSAKLDTSGSGVYFILVSVFVSVLISAVVLGLEASVVLVDSTLLTSYTFDFDALIAAVYAAW